MRALIVRSGAPLAGLLLLLLLPAACARRTVNLVNPQTGASFECSGSAFGFASIWLQRDIDDCVARSQSRGYVPVDQLTGSERADLESRGLLPKTP
jgi:hypothetical protein